MAAHTRVPLPCGVMRVRLSIAAVLLLALASAVPAAPPRDPNAAAAPSSFSFKLDSDHSAKVTAESSYGDAYNEETLRRDFQALWNTQFFEDVKLRVEDSPDGPNHKNVIFEVKERPVIRRIRYDGIHSVSESDILDRFKERKVGLSVESQFDPTR